MSMFGRSGSRFRTRSRSRRSARLSTSSLKSHHPSRGSRSESVYDHGKFRRSASARSHSSCHERRSASLHDVHFKRSRSSKTRQSLGGRPSDACKGTVLTHSDAQSARNSYSGVTTQALKETYHPKLRPTNFYNEISASEGDTFIDFQKSASNSAAHKFMDIETGLLVPDTNGKGRRFSSRSTGHSYTEAQHVNFEQLHLSRSNSQKSATPHTGFSIESGQFQRSRSEKSHRSANTTLYPCEADHDRPSHCRRMDQGYSVCLSNDMFIEDAIWDRTPSLRSRYSLPGDVAGYFKPSTSWARRTPNKSAESILMYGSVLCVDLNNSVFGDETDDGRVEARCESYLSPHCQCHETELSFDDERQLVRTTVGWNPRSGEENQPDYGAFTYQLREAGKESENVIEFACKTSNIICNTLLVTVLVGLSMTLPITMVSMGVKYLDDCPKEPRVPVYLLVGGCFGLIKLSSTLWRNIQARRYQDIELVFDDSDDADGAFASTTYRTMDSILFLFLVGWQGAGTYWTCGIWKPLFRQKLHEPRNWCDESVYMFTVYQLCGCYGAMLLYLSVLIMLTCCYRCCRCRSQ